MTGFRDFCLHAIERVHMRFVEHGLQAGCPMGAADGGPQSLLEIPPSRFGVAGLRLSCPDHRGLQAVGIDRHERMHGRKGGVAAQQVREWPRDAENHVVQCAGLYRRAQRGQHEAADLRCRRRLLPGRLTVREHCDGRRHLVERPHIALELDELSAGVLVAALTVGQERNSVVAASTIASVEREATSAAILPTLLKEGLRVCDAGVERYY